MSKRWFPWLRGVVWLMLGIFLWCGAAGALATREGLWQGERVSFRSTGEGFSASDMDALRDVMAENNGGDVVGWAQALSSSISAEETSGSDSVDVLWVDGNASLLWNLRCVNGDLPALGDDEGCAIDQETALTIFGSLQVIGKTVSVGGQELIVRGIYEKPKGLTTLGVDPGRGIAICSYAAAPEDVTLSSLEFRVLGDGSKVDTDQAQDWMRSASLSTSGTFDDHREERIMLQILITCPAYLLFLFFFIEIFGAAKRIAQSALSIRQTLRDSHVAPASQTVLVCLSFGIALALLLGVGYAVTLFVPPMRSIPPSYLPTKWSDFSFWSTLIESGLQDKAKQALTVSLRPDMIWRNITNWCVWLSVLSIAALWKARNVFTRSAKCVSITSALLLECAICGSVPMSMLALGWVGWVSDISLNTLYLSSALYLSIAIIRVGKAEFHWQRVTWRLLTPVKIKV